MSAYTRAFWSAGAAVLAALLILVVPAAASLRQRSPQRSARKPGVSTDVAHRRDRRARGCPDANAHPGHVSRRAIRAAVVCLVNKQRISRGLPALRDSGDLTRSAQNWSNAMAASGSFTHGDDFAARISSAGYRWTAAGENIAMGYPTPSSVVQAWMASADHCQNILDPTYRDVGVGINGRRLWTEDFALAASERPRSHNWGPAQGCPYN
jgi:uncharacterized protein YkwD